MNNRLYRLAASGNPFVQILALLVFGIVLIGAVLMGALVLALVFGLAVIGAAVFSVRLWWLRRKLQRQQTRSGARSRSPQEGRYIEAEYTIVTERERQDERERERR